MGLWARRLLGSVLFPFALGCGGMSERSRDVGDSSAGASSGGNAPEAGGTVGSASGAGGMGGRASGSGGTIQIPDAGVVDDSGIDPRPCSAAANVPKESFDVGGCDFATPPRFPGEAFDPEDANYLNVIVTRDEGGTPLHRVPGPDDCLDELGWYFDAAGPETIFLCPAACAFVLKSDVGLMVVYGCEGLPPLPD